MKAITICVAVVIAVLAVCVVLGVKSSLDMTARCESAGGVAVTDRGVFNVCVEKSSIIDISGPSEARK